MSVAPQGGEDPQRAQACLTFGRGLFRVEKSAPPCYSSPLKKRAPPPTPSPAPSGSASHHPEPSRRVGGTKPPRGSSLAWEPVPVKFPGYSIAKTTAPGGGGWGELASFPNWQVMTAPPRPGEAVTSASGGGNEVGGVEGLEPAWGVSGASKQRRKIKQIPLGPRL